MIDKEQIIKRIVEGNTFENFPIDDGAEYLWSIYINLPKEEQGDFIAWLDEKRKETEPHIKGSDPKYYPDIEQNKIVIAINSFKEQLTPSIHIKDWIERTRMIAILRANREVRLIEKRLKIIPDSERKEFLVKKWKYWFNELEANTSIDFDLTESFDSVYFWCDAYGFDINSRLPSFAKDVEQNTMPRQKLDNISFPSLKAKHMVDMLNAMIVELDNPPKPEVLPRDSIAGKNGLNSKHNPDKLKEVYIFLTDKGWIESTEENFLATFSDEELPEEWTYIKWIKKGKKNEPHKTGLYTLICFLSETSTASFPFSNKTFSYFRDKNGSKIPVNKQKNDIIEHELERALQA